jgi:hypothetical protein
MKSRCIGRAWGWQAISFDTAERGFDTDSQRRGAAMETVDRTTACTKGTAMTFKELLRREALARVDQPAPVKPAPPKPAPAKRQRP